MQWLTFLPAPNAGNIARTVGLTPQDGPVIAQ
jgi:hypothetical protein